MKILQPVVPLTLALALASFSAFPATMEGMHFDDSIRLDSTELKLNGLGLRAVLFIRGYVAGLYLSEKVTTAKEVLAASGPKRIQMRMLRGADAEDFNKALVSGMRKNASESELAKLQERLGQLEQVIADIGTVRKGDTITLDYAPAHGMTVALNGVVKGQSIHGADFYRTLLEIFVGDNPVDPRLKRGLLGQ
jgi:Chalcone isomerase-like